ncbi:MAG: NUDIX hydrolase [Actinomycetaceae bacterium]|nr:NUDIX hydrolase [Actinomycetaceae bacterium]
MDPISQRAHNNGLQEGTATTQFTALDGLVRLDSFTAALPSGHYPYIRLLTASGRDGAVVIPFHNDQVLFIRHPRPIPGVHLWEFPRGMGDPEDLSLEDTAIRELKEETGLSAHQLEFLGFIYPDSGILANRVGVYIAYISPEGEILDPDEASESAWVSVDRAISELGGDGFDGMTLAALSLLTQAKPR